MVGKGEAAYKKPLKTPRKKEKLPILKEMKVIDTAMRQTGG